MADLVPMRGRKRDLTSRFDSGDGGDSGGGNHIPPIPTHCGHDPNCRNEAIVIRVEASVKGGKRKMYAPSEVINRKGDALYPAEGVTFHGWRSFCAKCFMQMSVAANQSQHPCPERFTWG